MQAMFLTQAGVANGEVTESVTTCSHTDSMVHTFGRVEEPITYEIWLKETRHFKRSNCRIRSVEISREKLVIVFVPDGPARVGS